MIPISKDQTYDHPDKDSGITYHFAYATGLKRRQLFSLFDLSRKIAEPYLPEARELIKKEKPKLKGNEFEKASLIKAAEISEKHGAEKMTNDQKEYYATLIDIFLIGWDSSTKTLPPFPTDGNISDCFIGVDFYKMGMLVSTLLPELTGIEIEATKN